jgi:hypothetical protein
MRKKLLGALSALLLLAGAATVSAIGVVRIAGYWGDPVGPDPSQVVHVPPDPVTGHTEVRWGPSMGQGMSGLGFTPNPAPPNPLAVGQEFEIGLLTHYNNPVQFIGTALIDLQVDLDLVSPATRASFLFTLSVEETPNAPGTCKYPGVTVCPDRIGLERTLPEQYFRIGHTPYTLVIQGFRQAGGPLAPELISEEQTENVASLIAMLVDACTRTPGYWKTHSSHGPAPYDDRWTNLGPDGSDTPFFLSDESYYEALRHSPRGNAYYILAHAYIAAELNHLATSPMPPDVLAAFDRARILFETYAPGEPALRKGGSSLRKEFIELAAILDAYNNGLIGPGHCR